MNSLVYKGVFLSLLSGLVCSTGCRSQTPQAQKEEPTARPGKTVSTQVYTVTDGSSSLIYVKAAGNETAHLLTKRKGGWETNPILSPDNSVVAYALADGPEAKSEVWVCRLDGSHAYRVSAADEDATMPAFGLDSKSLLYVKSRFTGNYSPIARPRKHDFDIEKAIIDPDGPVAGLAPIELTQQHFFDLLSLSVSPDGQRFLVSTSGYPIGSLIEEFDTATPLKIKKIFQPHVPSEPSTGPSFGQAAYIHGGMDIVFTAATEGQGGKFDYNIYQMSDVTGGELKVLTYRSGMIDEMTVGKDGFVSFAVNGKTYRLNPETKDVESN